MILIVSAEEDDHATAVIKRLSEQKVKATLLDLSAYPQAAHLTMLYNGEGGHDFKFELLKQPETIRLTNCRVAWWRRPQPVIIHPEIANPLHESFARNEIHEAMSGLWLALDAFWINDPTRDEQASHKSYQLKIARMAGMEIPETCITSSPEQARAFVDSQGVDRTIYKLFTATENTWRETRILKREELQLLDSVRFAPVIFQEYVAAEADLRITVMGEEIFAASINSPDLLYHIDYRMELGKAQMEPFDLPNHVIERIRRFMQRLGLVYGAIDMRLTPDGRYVFLEINPAGQWLFVEEKTGQPMTEAFTKLLVSRLAG